MIEHTPRYDGIVATIRRPTIKKSRGKEYPSIDIRNFDTQKFIKTASLHRLCPIIVYPLKNELYFLKVIPEFDGRITITCRYGLKANEDNLKMICGRS